MDKLIVVEHKLKDEISKTKELIDIARKHQTPFIEPLKMQLFTLQQRLKDLSKLKNENPTEKDIVSFLNLSEKAAFNKFEHVLNPERLRIKLLIASLYLTAYELLANSIIKKIENFFVPLPSNLPLAKPFEKENHQLRQMMLDKYKNELNVKYSAHENFKFKPSCKWLQKNGVITEEEFDEIISFRDQRNYLAHNLLEVILDESDKFIAVEDFVKMKNILKKIQLFWIRLDLDAKGISKDIPNNDISGGWVFFDLIINTVLDFLK